MGTIDPWGAVYRALCAAFLWRCDPIVYVRRALGICNQGNRADRDSQLRSVCNPRTLGVLYDGRRTNNCGGQPDRRLSGSAVVGLAFLAAGLGTRMVDAATRTFDRDRDYHVPAFGVLMADARTIATYDAKAADYAALVTSDGPDKTLQSFIDLVPKGGKVLDLGCGPGTSSAHMRDAGLAPDPLDASEGMIAIAREKFGLDARIGRFDDISGVEIYDAVWANFSLLHASRKDLPRHLNALCKATKPGGILHIGMKTGDGTERDAINRLYTYVTVAELQDLLMAAGYEVTYTKEGREAGLAGTIDPFVILRAKKA